MKMSKVKIKKTKKNDIKKSGYYQLYGNEDIAEIFRIAQSATIRNGNELQDIILSEVTVFKPNGKVELKQVLDLINQGQSFYIPNFKITKSQLEEVGIILKGKKKIDVDAIFFKDGVLYVIEYKQGDNLDTKKSQGEIESLNKIFDFFIHYGITVKPKLVMWICDDVKNSSIKTTEHNEYLITGSEMSEILGISFDNIQMIRSMDQQDNIDFIKEQFRKILGL